MLLDALAVVDWAVKVARVSLRQIVILGQSMGTAVTLGICSHLALQSPPVVLAGTVLVAPFVDIATLVTTYRIAGSTPLLSPLAHFPVVFNYLRTLIPDTWLSKDRIAEYVRVNEANGAKYRLTLILAKDDYDIPWHHTPALFRHAVNATVLGVLGTMTLTS
jgi:abhydrolase domain-containing protein 12